MINSRSADVARELRKITARGVDFASIPRAGQTCSPPPLRPWPARRSWIGRRRAPDAQGCPRRPRLEFKVRGIVQVVTRSRSCSSRSSFTDVPRWPVSVRPTLSNRSPSTTSRPPSRPRPAGSHQAGHSNHQSINQTRSAPMSSSTAISTPSLVGASQAGGEGQRPIPAQFVPAYLERSCAARGATTWRSSERAY